MLPVKTESFSKLIITEEVAESLSTEESLIESFVVLASPTHVTIVPNEHMPPTLNVRSIPITSSITLSIAVNM